MLYYETLGDGDKVAVILHGWGANGKSVLPVAKILTECGYKCYVPDFYGFGKTPFPEKDLTVFDYAQAVKELITSQNLRSVLLVGHSFGGRVCTVLANESFVKALILVDSAGQKPRTSLKKEWKILRYKIARKTGRSTEKFGSRDYLALPDNMKKTFVSVVNDHLDGLVKRIEKKTVILWGSNDRETPLYMAKRYAKRIKNSTLLVIDGGGHFPFAERYNAFRLKFLIGLSEIEYDDGKHYQ